MKINFTFNTRVCFTLFILRQSLTGKKTLFCFLNSLKGVLIL